MDVFDYRASHKVNTEGVFTATGNEMEIGGLFLRLKNVMTTELHLQWDLVFLQQYISEGMVPRSLRWEVQPQQGETDSDSWFKYFNDVGISFLNVLISKKNSRLLSLDREIKELKDKLLMYKNSQEYSSLSSNLLNHLEKEDREQKYKKQKKYSRDIGDYKTNNVFSWQKLFKVASSTESSVNDMEVNPPSYTQVASTTRAPPSSSNGGRTSRSQERQRGVSYSSQSRIRHFSPQTPRRPSRGRGNYRGKRGSRGNFRGNNQHSDAHLRREYESFPYRDYDNQSYHRPLGGQGTWQDPNYEENSYYRYPSSPFPTHNRYSPLRNVHSSSDRRGDHGDYSYTHGPNTYDNQGFREDRHPKKRGPDLREDVGEAGNYRGEKRKRV